MGFAVAPAALTYARRLDVADVSRWCLVPGECVRVDPMAAAAVVVGTGLAILLFTVALVHIEEARALLAEERERTREERDAFAAFAERVAAIDVPSEQAPVGAGSGITPIDGPPPDGRLREVKEAYRETVMAISHYEEDYDEPLEANMTAELGGDLAAAVAEDATLTAYLQAAFVGKAREAVARREGFLSQLEEEADAVDDAAARLGGVEDELAEMNETPLSGRSVDELVGAWERLSELRGACRSVLRDRQARLQEGAPGPDDGPSLHDYLYEPLSVRHPVLAAGTDLVGQIDTARDRVAAAVARRP